MCGVRQNGLGYLKFKSLKKFEKICFGGASASVGVHFAPRMDAAQRGACRKTLILGQNQLVDGFVIWA